MRPGTTLLQVLLAVVLIGVLIAMAVPRLAEPLDRLAVERSGYDLAAAHGRARLEAVLQGRVALLTISPDSMLISVVTPTLPPDTQVVWRRPGPRVEDGVFLSGPARVITFAPTGLATGVSNATFTLSKGRARMDVIVSRLGRVKIVP